MNGSFFGKEDSENIATTILLERYSHYVNSMNVIVMDNPLIDVNNFSDVEMLFCQLAAL